MTPPAATPLSALDFHVLLALAREDLYGYAIMKAAQAQSRGSVSPEIGSLYRVLARLMKEGWVQPLQGVQDADAETHPGRPRRYYRITPPGRAALAAEAERLRQVVALADRVLPEARG
jgi:DNA-binding PadR family transcriptional regulator